MLQPSSLPLGVRSVEWLRNHHGNWLVDEVEHVYYGWKAPHKGGPQLKALPTVGLSGRRAKPLARVTAWPPRIKPVFPVPLPREGIWTRTGPLVDGRAPVLVTTFRSELAYPRIVAYVAWFDHVRTALAFYPGRYEPPSAPVRGPMSVPSSQRWRLFATFNGGFTYVDGHNGSAINGLSYEPLKDGLATLIGYRNGRLDIKTWTGGSNAGPTVEFARQSLPLIIQGGRLNPALNDTSQWGYTLGNAGAVRAMQLDINPEWPTMITYRHYHGLVPDKIVPNVQQPATRYLVADDRDFFAVYRRLPGPVTVPFK